MLKRQMDYLLKKSDSATIILCYDGDFAPCTTRNISQFSEGSVKCNKKYRKKKISDVVTLGTFCYRDRSFINKRGSVIFISRKERY